MTIQQRIWLSLLGLSYFNQYKLLQLLKDKNPWEVKSVSEIPIIKGINNYELQRKILSPKLKERAKKVEDDCHQHNIKITWPTDKHYPYLLEFTDDKPTLLYYKGDLRKNEKHLAVIGSRNATSYGLDMAFTFAKELSKSGLGIASGMARGVDTYAHAGALKANGRTLAVLGNGLDFSYPPENKNLMSRIIQNGAVISEYPPGTKPLHYHFPARNRIIAGISLGILVTEAREDSGSQITIDYALKQGKEIFALPNSINNRKSQGSNKMIKDGAYLVTDYLDIIMVLKKSFLFPEHLTGKTSMDVDFSVPMEVKNSLTEIELEIVNLLETGIMHIDALSQTVEIKPEELSIWLLMLSLKGIIEEIPGRKYKIRRTFI